MDGPAGDRISGRVTAGNRGRHPVRADSSMRVCRTNPPCRDLSTYEAAGRGAAAPQVAPVSPAYASLQNEPTAGDRPRRGGGGNASLQNEAKLGQARRSGQSALAIHLASLRSPTVAE